MRLMQFVVRTLGVELNLRMLVDGAEGLDRRLAGEDLLARRARAACRDSPPRAGETSRLNPNSASA